KPVGRQDQHESRTRRIEAATDRDADSTQASTATFSVAPIPARCAELLHPWPAHLRLGYDDLLGILPCISRKSHVRRGRPEVRGAVAGQERRRARTSRGGRMNDEMIAVPKSLLKEIVDELQVRRRAIRELELKYEGKPIVFERDLFLSKIWGLWIK